MDGLKPIRVIQASSTINDVARLANVSIKTVSRVMNNEPNVRPETRIKVTKAAKQLNYSPNLLARTLAGARSFLIGLLYDNPNPSYINDMHKGVIERARLNNYHLLMEPQDATCLDIEKTIGALLSTIRLDGVVLTPPLCDMSVVLEAIEAANVPYIRISPHLNEGRSPCVRMDEEGAAYQMTKHLFDLGHSDIGFVIGHPQHGGSHLRYQGFLRAMKEREITPNHQWIKQGYFSYESGVEAGRSFFADGEKRPTAIFASNDYMAFGIMAQAQIAGIRIPEDISIVGFDDAPGSMLIWPHLTTIRQPVYDMAYLAADILLDRKDSGVEKPEIQDHLLPFELIMRQSTKAR